MSLLFTLWPLTLQPFWSSPLGLSCQNLLPGKWFYISHWHLSMNLIYSVSSPEESAFLALAQDVGGKVLPYG